MQPVNTPQGATPEIVNISNTTLPVHDLHNDRVPRWAAVIGTLAIGFLYLALPQELTFGPSWLLGSLNCAALAIGLLDGQCIALCHMSLFVS